VKLALLSCWPSPLPARAEDEDEDEDEDENEDQSTKMLPSKVALGLKGLVVAGTAYGLALLYTGPKIETELRQGPEMQGLKVGHKSALLLPRVRAMLLAMRGC
jgi:hypothetical protein